MKTGFKDLDAILEFNKGDLVVVASRPAMGKSTFVLNILTNIALKEKKNVLFFSLEDSKEHLIKKLIISNSMVEAEKFELYNKYKNNEIQKLELSEDDWDRIAYGINILKDAPIYIASDVPYSINDICINSTRFKKEKNIEAIIIDYLQLVQFNKKKLLSRDEETTEILRKLKVLAKILDIPVIITSQLSRECEKREDKKPNIEDFANSKNAIDKYADKILFLYRDSYYNKENKSNLTDVIIAKNLDGNLDTIKVAWMPEYCMFANIRIIENNYPVMEIQPNEKYLQNAKVYIERNEEVIPHFILVLENGCSFKIMLEKAQYIKPISRKLNKNEIKTLISYLKKTEIPDFPNDYMHVVCGRNFWHECVCLWNHETVEYKENCKDEKLPNYKRIENEDEIDMPDYIKLNTEEEKDGE